MCSNFINNYKEICKKLNEECEQSNSPKNVFTCIYSMNYVLNYPNMLKNIKELYKQTKEYIHRFIWKDPVMSRIGGWTYKNIVQIKMSW